MSFYENHNLDYEELPFIYNRSLAKPTGYLPGSSNWHENVEIIYVTEGEGRINNNGEVISVETGDVIFINSNHLHSICAGDSKMLYSYLIVDRSFCLENGFDTNLISFNTRVGSEEVREAMDRIDGLYYAPKELPYRTLAIRSEILRLMLILCKDHSTQISRAERADSGIAYTKRALDYIHASFDKSFSLEDAAAFVGVHKCYLSREFHKYTGYHFVEYVNLTRIKVARRLLAEGRLSVGEIGKHCGFENRSYFAKTFARFTGMRPGEYRAYITKSPSDTAEPKS